MRINNELEQGEMDRKLENQDLNFDYKGCTYITLNKEPSQKKRK